MKKIYAVMQKAPGGERLVHFVTFDKAIADEFVKAHIGHQFIYAYWIEQVELRE